jgi:hypothetical protein
MRALVALFASWQIEHWCVAFGQSSSELVICSRVADTITGSIKVVSFALGMLKEIRVAAALRIAILLL